MRGKAILYIIKSSIQNTLLFKGSFFIRLVTVFMAELSSIIVMFVLLSSFQGYGEITSGQFVFLYFFAHVSYSICTLIFNNLRALGMYIQAGMFDRMLLMPMNTMAYICAYNFDFSGIGQVVTSLLLFLYFSTSYGITWNLCSIVCTIIMLLGSILILASILIVLSSAAYFIIDWKPLDNMFGAFREMLWYPTTIYNKVVQVILYSFVPIAYIVFVPAKLLFSMYKNPGMYLLISIGFLIITFILFLISYKIWVYMSRKYQSVG